MKDAPTLGWSDFALQFNSRSSGNSYATCALPDVIKRTQDNWFLARAGDGETTLDRKVVVPIRVFGIYPPPRAKLVAGMNLKTVIKARQPGEDPFVETYVEESEAKRCDAFREIRASRAEVVCYSAAALLENDGKRSTDCDWEIVCLLAYAHDHPEPMKPLTMARNYLEKPGGTKSDYTALQFAESIYYWHTQSGIKVKLSDKP